MSEKSRSESENGKRALSANTHKSRRFWLIILIAVIAAAVVMFSGWMRSPISSDTGLASTFETRKDDLTITVTESGSTKANQTIDIRSEVYGEATIISIVPEGTYITQEDVDAGKLLVELDSSSLVDRLKEEEKGLASDEAMLTEAQENYHIQRNQNESDITAAELAVQFGLLDLQSFLGKSASQKLLDIVTKDPNATIETATLVELFADANNLGGEALQTQQQSENDILLARGQLEKATDVYTGTKKLFDANYASTLDLKSADLDVQRYQVQKDSAEESLRLYKLYSLPKQAMQLLSDYREAQHELRRTEARARSRMAQAQARLSNAEEEVSESREDVDRREKQVAACTIRAPAPGLVVYGTTGSYRSRDMGPIQEGGKVYQRQKIISLPDTAELIVEIRVHEASVDKVRPGQPATITAEAFPDKTLHGKVLSVAPLPDTQRSYLSPDVKVYITKVSVDGTHPYLRPGMSAKAEILVEQLEDVMIVPVQVVANRSGRKVCYIATDSGPKERQVETGAFNDTFVEIVSGLEVGENVLMIPPRIIDPQPDSKPRETVTAVAEKESTTKKSPETKPTTQNAKPL
ncbi:MAG: HlyD family efflux transporter periplasmic adaptor subunit [Planctomycetes bacterium]|nr:HlyD family efflux transporter periplasmic adaptor subunit [Planctomycetota bacterium]